MNGVKVELSFRHTKRRRLPCLDDIDLYGAEKVDFQGSTSNEPHLD